MDSGETPSPNQNGAFLWNIQNEQCLLGKKCIIIIKMLVAQVVPNG